MSTPQAPCPVRASGRGRIARSERCAGRAAGETREEVTRGGRKRTRGGPPLSPAPDRSPRSSPGDAAPAFGGGPLTTQSLIASLSARSRAERKDEANGPPRSTLPGASTGASRRRRARRSDSVVGRKPNRRQVAATSVQLDGTYLKVGSNSPMVFLPRSRRHGALRREAGSSKAHAIGCRSARAGSKGGGHGGCSNARRMDFTTTIGDDLRTGLRRVIHATS